MDSVRGRAQLVPIQVSRECVRHVSKFDLKVKPYTIAVKHMLTEDDMREIFYFFIYFCTIVHRSQGLLGHFSVRVTMLMLLNGTTPP